jgi:uncharacterized protein GlcG (DUF336 family)
VSVSSLSRYRRSLVSFVRTLPIWLERQAAGGVASEGSQSDEDDEAAGSGLRAIEGGLG